MSDPSPPRLDPLRRDRVILGAGLAGVTILAWLYLLRLARAMPAMEMADMAMSDMAMAQMHPWGPVDALLLFVMWTVMMVAMMLPTAVPMILMFATISRKRKEQQRPFVPTGIFVLGYVVVWSAYAGLAALAQWGLHERALLSPAMTSTSPLLGGALLVAAGVFQWTPLKRACLANCRSPLSFLITGWREGTVGAFVMGLRHGAYCVGCCWILMALLFVVGVMNLLWVAAIAAFVLVEKALPGGETVGRIAGAALVLGGVLAMSPIWRPLL